MLGLAAIYDIITRAIPMPHNLFGGQDCDPPTPLPPQCLMDLFYCIDVSSIKICFTCIYESYLIYLSNFFSFIYRKFSLNQFSKFAFVKLMISLCKKNNPCEKSIPPPKILCMSRTCLTLIILLYLHNNLCIPQMLIFCLQEFHSRL